MKRTITILSALMLTQGSFAAADEAAEVEPTAAEVDALKLKEQQLIEELAKLR